MVTTQITVTVYDKPNLLMTGKTKKDNVKIHAAATCFVFVSRELQQIAKTFGLQERTIRRWRDDEPEWEKTLRTIGYTGTRLFKKSHTRDTESNTADFQRVKHAYRKERDQGVPKSRKIRDSVHRYDWKKKTRSLLRKVGEIIFLFKQIVGVF